MTPKYLEGRERRKKFRQQRAEVTGKTASPQRQVVHRLGFHSLVSNYAGGNTIYPMSGSSINRSIRKNEKALRPESTCRGKAHAIGELRRCDRKSDEIPSWVYPGILSEEEVARVRASQQVPAGNGKNVQPVHFLSSRSKGIVRARFTAFYRAVPRRKILCTLTFVNDVADTDAVRILNKFLNSLRKEFPQLQYIWVAERQEKNTGRIHFHMVLNCFLPIKRFNGLWLLQQYNSGIAHEKATIEQVRAAFENGTTQTLFNPVDVTPVKNIRHLSSYLTKYITKGDNKGGFGCQTWHCSREVSKLFLRTVVGWEVLALAKSDENARFNRGTGEYYGPPTVFSERGATAFLYTVVNINQPGRFLFYLREMESINRWLISREVDSGDVIDYFRDRLN